jgi:hypothetical protein
MRRDHRRGAIQGLPGRQSDVCIQRVAVRVADQSVPKANASYAADIGHERSGTQPAEASASRPRASILRPTPSRSMRSATYDSGPNPDSFPLKVAPWAMHEPSTWLAGFAFLG